MYDSSTRTECAARGLAIVGTLLICLAPLGCQSTNMQGVQTPDAALVHPTELHRTSQQMFQNAIAQFYEDDWQAVSRAANQLGKLAQRWNELPPPRGEDALYEEYVETFSSAARALGQAANDEDVQASTLALREMADALAGLESMR